MTSGARSVAEGRRKAAGKAKNLSVCLSVQKGCHDNPLDSINLLSQYKSQAGGFCKQFSYTIAPVFKYAKLMRAIAAEAAPTNNRYPPTR